MLCSYLLEFVVDSMDNVLEKFVKSVVSLKLPQTQKI